MEKNIKTMIKGGLIGIANIIPGVSGGTMALTLGIYEKLIDSISNFFKDIKKNIKFLSLIILGAIISIILGSSIVGYGLDSFPVPTTLFFIGLIAGGLPFLYKKANKLKKENGKAFAFLFFLLIVGFAFLNGEGTGVSLQVISFELIIKLFLVGMIAAATMVIPGISGSLVLMIIGFYRPIVDTLSNLTNLDLLSHNLSILIPFGLGVLIGIVLVAKIIERLLSKFPNQTYSAVMGIILGSLVLIIKPFFTEYNITFFAVVIGLVLSNVGTYIALKLGE